MAKDQLPKEPECHPIQYPGAPARIGADTYNVSTKIDPNSVIKHDSRMPDGAGKKPNF